MKISEILSMDISQEEKDEFLTQEHNLINLEVIRLNGIKRVIAGPNFPEDPSHEEYKTVIDAWLPINQAELDRLENIKSRYRVMFQYDSGMPAFCKLYPDKSNATYFFEKEIYDMSKEDAEEALSNIEEEFTIIKLANQEKTAIDNRIIIGKTDREKCTKALDYISWYNTDKDFSIEQITQMQISFSDAEQALRAGRPSMAISFISAIEPDGVIITSDLKSKVLSLLA
jgi:hypothetical protein